jgi:periplasmic divalent cation tolerance protein
MRIVLCNCSPQQASTLARVLVDEGLAACVNVLPAVRSYYRWEGVVQEDEEHTLLIKTSTEAVGRLSDRLRELHSYDLPEILVLKVDEAASDPGYLAWVRRLTEVLP